MKRKPERITIPDGNVFFLHYLARHREDPFAPLSEEERQRYFEAYEQDIADKESLWGKAYDALDYAEGWNYYGQVSAYLDLWKIMPDFFEGSFRRIIARLEFFYRIYEDRDGFYSNYLDLAKEIEDYYKDLPFDDPNIDYFQNYDFVVYARCLYEAAMNAIAFAHYDVAKDCLFRLDALQKKHMLYDIDLALIWTLGHLEDKKSLSFTRRKAKSNDLAYLCLLLRDYKNKAIDKETFKAKLKERSPYLYEYMKAGKWYYQIERIPADTPEGKRASTKALRYYAFPSWIPEAFEEIFKK